MKSSSVNHSCNCMPLNKEEQETAKDVKIIDISRYQPKKVPSLKWKECIKKIWKDDPLICPECLTEMKIISFITEGILIKKSSNILNFGMRSPQETRLSCQIFRARSCTSPSMIAGVSQVRTLLVKSSEVSFFEDCQIPSLILFMFHFCPFLAPL